MERLTDKRFAKEGYFALTREERDSLYIPSVEEIYRKLAEYEDLEERGRLIRLPCTIGDKVYPLTYGLYPEMIVTSIQYSHDINYEHDYIEFEVESVDHISYDVFELNDMRNKVFLIKMSVTKK